MFIAKIQSPAEPIPLILASASLGRAYVLRQSGMQFQVDAADIDEHNFTADTTAKLVRMLALAKAKKVQERHSFGIIVATDTLVVIENKIIGKPKNDEDAIAILTQLSSKTHQVISGIVALDLSANKMVQDIVITPVTFKKLLSREIVDYVATGEPFGKAGAYSSQEKGKFLIEKIDGDPTNVIGLPLQSFFKLLTELGLVLVDK